MKKLVLFFIFLSLSFASSELYKEAVSAFNSGDCEKAEKLYKELADKNHFEAMFNYGWMSEKGQCAEQDYKKARELYERAINGDSQNSKKLSSYRLGLLLLTARGSDSDVSDADIKRAISLWQSSESLGYPQASMALGTLYLQGGAVQKDEKKAREYFTRACDGGVKEACGIIANLKVE